MSSFVRETRNRRQPNRFSDEQVVYNSKQRASNKNTPSGNTPPGNTPLGNTPPGNTSQLTESGAAVMNDEPHEMRPPKQTPRKAVPTSDKLEELIAQQKKKTEEENAIEEDNEQDIIKNNKKTNTKSKKRTHSQKAKRQSKRSKNEESEDEDGWFEEEPDGDEDSDVDEDSDDNEELDGDVDLDEDGDSNNSEGNLDLIDITDRMQSSEPLSVTDERKECCKGTDSSLFGATRQPSPSYNKNETWAKVFMNLVCFMTNVKSLYTYMVHYKKPEFPKITLLSKRNFVDFLDVTTDGTKDVTYAEMQAYHQQLPKKIPNKHWSDGIFGVSPVKLLYLVYRDLHCWKGPNPSKGLFDLPWQAILTWEESISDPQNPPFANLGSYAMLHWKNREYMTGLHLDPKEIGMEYVSKELLVELEVFGFNIIRFLFPDDYNDSSDDEIREDFKVFPGFVFTKQAYHQHMHLDENSKHPIFIVHFPLCRDGLFLRIAKSKNDRNFQAIHVPFGSFLVLPASVYHSGVYGKSGNYRLHIAIRSTKSTWTEDKLFEFPKEEKQPTEELDHKNVNWKSWRKPACSKFALRYECMLLRECNIWYRVMFANNQKELAEAAVEN